MLSGFWFLVLSHFRTKRLSALWTSSVKQRDLDEGVVFKQVFRTAAFATSRLSRTRPVTTPFRVGIIVSCHKRGTRAAADLNPQCSRS
jgi:hypothetical protein